MAGPGAKRMGGGGAKPPAPKTAMAGKPVGGPSIGGGGLGAPPAPHPAPPPKPPMAPPVGAAPPMPGGGGAGGGGMGGSGGFEAGGPIPPSAPEARFERGGSVGGDTKGRVGRDTGTAGKSS